MNKPQTPVPNPAWNSGAFWYVLQQYSLAIGFMLTVVLSLLELGIQWGAHSLGIHVSLSILIVFFTSGFFFLSLYCLPYLVHEREAAFRQSGNTLQHPSLPDLPVGQNPGLLVSPEPVIATLFRSDQPILDPGVRLDWIPDTGNLEFVDDRRKLIERSGNEKITLARYCRIPNGDIRAFCNHLCQRTGADLIWQRDEDITYLKNEEIGESITKRLSRDDLPPYPDVDTVQVKEPEKNTAGGGITWKPTMFSQFKTDFLVYLFCIVIAIGVVHVREDIDVSDFYLFKVMVVILLVGLASAKFLDVLFGADVNVTPDGMEYTYRKFGIWPVRTFIPSEDIEDIVIEKKDWKTYTRLAVAGLDQYQRIGYGLKKNDAEKIRTCMLHVLLDDEQVQ